MEILAVILFAAGVLINPSGAMLTARDAIAACVNSVIPSLFPFFVCSRMLIEMGAAEKLGKILAPLMKPLFGVGGGGALVFVIGILSGYPVGASAAADLAESGQCTKSEAEKLLGYCNNSGPLFILGTIGAGLLGNAQLGWILYISHIMSVLTVAVIMRKIPCEISCKKRKEKHIKQKHFGQIMAEAVSNGAQSVFTVCGFVIIFSILTGNLESFGVLQLFSLTGIEYNVLKAFLFGFFEPVGGCVTTSNVFFNYPVIRCMILSAIIGWSGVSVHLQVLGIIKRNGLSAKYYFLGKVGTTLISPVYTHLLLKIFPQSVATNVFSPSNMASYAPFPYISWFVCVSVIFALLLQLVPVKNIEFKKGL